MGAPANLTMWHCFRHFVHLDHSNAAIHSAPVRYSPITFRLAEALDGLRLEAVPEDHLSRALLDDVLVHSWRLRGRPRPMMTAPAELRAECTQPGGDGIIIPKATVLRLFDLIDRLDAWIRTLDFDEVEDGCGPERSSAALIAEVDAWRRGETT